MGILHVLGMMLPLVDVALPFADNTLPVEDMMVPYLGMIMEANLLLLEVRFSAGEEVETYLYNLHYL